MPCLNEAKTVGICVAKAAAYLRLRDVDGEVIVKGTVPSRDQQEQVARLLLQCVEQGRSLDLDVSVMSVPPSDSLEGRGRSPSTGTSADSAHESRHQLDRT